MLATCCLIMKILTEKKYCYLGMTQFSLAPIFYFSFPNIFKIKDKILVTVSLVLKMASSVHQNIKKRVKELIHTFLT